MHFVAKLIWMEPNTCSSTDWLIICISSQGYREWNGIPQELFQMQPWRVHNKPFQLHCTWGPALLQTPPHPTDKGERQLKPARGRPWEGYCKWESQSQRSCSRVMICARNHSPSTLWFFLLRIVMQYLWWCSLPCSWETFYITEMGGIPECFHIPECVVSFVSFLVLSWRT